MSFFFVRRSQQIAFSFVSFSLLMPHLFCTQHICRTLKIDHEHNNITHFTLHSHFTGEYQSLTESFLGCNSNSPWFVQNHSYIGVITDMFHYQYHFFYDKYFKFHRDTTTACIYTLSTSRSPSAYTEQ